MNISKEQANVYKILSEIFLKVLVTITFLGVFIAIVIQLLYAEPTWSKTAPLAIIEGILSMTIYKMVDYFFPRKNK